MSYVIAEGIHINVSYIVRVKNYRKIIYLLGQGQKYRLRKTEASLISNQLFLFESIWTQCNFLQSCKGNCNLTLEHYDSYFIVEYSVFSDFCIVMRLYKVTREGDGCMEGRAGVKGRVREECKAVRSQVVQWPDLHLVAGCRVNIDLLAFSTCCAMFKDVSRYFRSFYGYGTYFFRW